MAPYEALYERRCRSPVGWFEQDEARLLGTNLVQDALDKVKLIQERLRTVQSRQKSYADRKVCDLSFTVGEKALLKVSPMKGVMSTVQLEGDTTYDAEPVAILDRQIQKLRSKDIASVKV
ncbi:uncharacterized protein [Nicotiana tomentosiformis]|uniref:uncharacterized protein n=1 Tax=Nicotiana tomentosiformis TaxID=4098 RepID=UPI00388C9B86